MKLNRKWITQTHLVLAALFLPLFLLLPLSGVAHLLGLDGGTVKTELFVLQTSLSPEMADAEVEKILVDELGFNGRTTRHESIKRSKDKIILRPSSRDHYSAELNSSGQWVVFAISPSFSDRLLELHKGHGPKLFKWLEIAFGIAILFVMASGTLMAASIPSYRRSFVVALFVGIGIVAASVF